jgi:type VI protein secretion system component Hcp
MTDETKDPAVDQKNGAQDQQLSEQALSNVAGGTPKQTTTTKDTLPTESVSLNYEQIKYQY